MELTQEQIDRIREYASDLTPVRDIAALMELDEDSLRAEIDFPGSEVGKVYRKAVAATALAIRRQEIQFARMGAPAAVQSASAYVASLLTDV
ncbi:hypothetical protein E4T81_05055 [Barnesiella sp. WM24]|uniref:hypothetical protein n=1 Tax=Barnesiella sp. WM24 TaxID=2558278 RepID=UPI0010723DFC|nr:hypothetical protein [Barnesiella sp. WM24]TFU93964.1 hypothetical protein E4T81_05055 [Barnesiella sp. WM24]